MHRADSTKSPAAIWNMDAPRPWRCRINITRLFNRSFKDRRQLAQ
ncbi:MAG: hypothetical protein [Olavius algarvensis Gamma 3 endosymbiont]|nr:MAG: hypothetical protein [Olavius algarvensis Gamma 3 endosymbiont]